MSTLGLPGQIGSGGQPPTQPQISKSHQLTNGFGFAAMSHLAQDLPFYIPQNMQMPLERIPQWNYNQHQFSPQDLQQMAMINLAHHQQQQQQQQWSPASVLYPQILQAHQNQQQQMASVSYQTPSLDQSNIPIDNDQSVTDQRQPTVIDQNQREKRALSDTEIELVESAEMDNDACTRMVMGSASKKARKALLENRVQGTQNSQRALILNNLFKDKQGHEPSTMMPFQQEPQRQQTQSYGQGENVEMGSSSMQRNHVQISNDARQFASTRYPFSPFSVIVRDDIRDKLIVEHLVQAAKDKFQFTLDIAGYRRTRVNDDFKVLIFVKTVNSFSFLMDKKVWPEVLCGKMYTLSMPTIPPQLSLVLPFVSYNTDMQELTADIQSLYPEVVNVIRLKNRNQQVIKAVKLELISDKVRKQILDSKRLRVGGISYEVVEYMAQAHVLVCSQCMGIGHFRKNCPQQQIHTCSICGDKSDDILQHKQRCTGISKCIHCEGDHKSNDSKCPKIKDYRAALTKSLLGSRLMAPTSKTIGSRASEAEFPALGPVHKIRKDNQGQPLLQEGSNDTKLDRVLDKLEHIQRQMTVFTNFIEEKNKSDVIIEKKLDKIDSRTSIMNDELSITQSVLLNVIDLVKALTENRDITIGGESINMLNSHRNTLYNMLMKSASITDNAL